MDEEKKVSEEDEKVVEPLEVEEPKSEEAKDDFEKENEVVPVGKYNQALRKQREAELEKKELEKQLEEVRTAKPDSKEEEKEEDSFFKDEEKEKEIPDPTKIIDERLKPVFDTLKRREESDRKIQRTAFFESHPEYLKDSEKWQNLLDEMDNSLNPNSNDDYYTQLEKTHRIISGNTEDVEVESKKREIASDAASSGDGAEKSTAKEEFTAEDRKQMKEFNVSVEGMRAYKKKLSDGSMRILS